MSSLTVLQLHTERCEWEERLAVVGWYGVDVAVHDLIGFNERTRGFGGRHEDLDVIIDA